MSKEEELEDLMKEEGSRGRRRPLVDAASRRQRQRLLKAFEIALREGDEQLFLEAIRRDLGLKDGSPEFVNAVRVWRKFRGEP